MAETGIPCGCPVSGCVWAGVMYTRNMTPMVKTQVYLPREDLDALHDVAERSG